MLTTVLAFFMLAAPAPRTTLDIYLVDVEGGAATLLVTPSGESLLIDTGWPRPDSRDPLRIADAMKLAGIHSIDHLLITHYHRDHWGGVEDLAKLTVIKNFYDHGRIPSLDDDKTHFPKLDAAYTVANHGQSHTLKPGDTIPMKDIQVKVLAANGETVPSSGPANAACAATKPMAPDPSDNAKSVGVVITFGKFRFLDLGDLTWNVEQKLVCPSNSIGKVDLYQVTHHGSAISGNTALLSAIHAQAAIMPNGPAKGGDKDTYHRLHAVPGLTIFQTHRNLATADEDNTAPERTANTTPEDACVGNFFKVAVAAGGASYKVTNSRTNQTWDFQTK